MPKHNNKQFIGGHYDFKQLCICKFDSYCFRQDEKARQKRPLFCRNTTNVPFQEETMYSNRNGFSIFPSLRTTMILCRCGFSNFVLPEEAARCERYDAPVVFPQEESLRFGNDGFSSYYYGRQQWI